MLTMISKMLYPHLERDQRKREIHNLFITLLTAALVAGSLAFLIVLLNRTGAIWSAGH
jgi:ribosomal protein L20